MASTDSPRASIRRVSANALLAASALTGALTMSAPALAVTDGSVDGDAHPAVVLILMEVDGHPAFRCSGTLIAPTYVLTAGHCAGAPGEFSGMRVFAESDVQSDPTYPYAGGPHTVEAVRWAAHPLYPTASFVVHDVGMIELAEPIDVPVYGTLPSPDQLDALQNKRGQQDVTFTAVGYGLQQSFPDPAYFLAHNVRVRYSATPRLLQINVPGFTGDFSMLLSNNANTGGTCFGDSGGANFYGSGPTETNIIAGVTSFGINGNCAGTGGVFRTDRQNVLDFIHAFMNP
jgi:secreted trypsin-like serine protease